MSEYDKIWQEWEQAKAKHYCKTGQRPVICLMGKDRYDAFLGAFRVRVNGLGWVDSIRVGLTVDGIAIYPSSGPPDGCWFGHIDEDVIV